MSFDRKTRNALAKMVGEARRILHADVAEQLQGNFGLQPDGSALDVAELSHLGPDDQEMAVELRAWQIHLAASATEPTERGRRTAAFRRMAHEVAFTTLNRLAAIRMAEERELVIESVRRGQASDGFRLFERLSGASLGDRDHAYAEYLGLLFDELAVELGVLFERHTPAGRIFPRPAALSSVLELLDLPQIAPLWAEDETIGWIYQYFNSKEERDAMRKASASPRNSRELAVRNQFFTPRYVVEFLTDNTLGRLWYEMRRGETRLAEECRYLVRRSTEVFLDAGARPPKEAASDDRACAPVNVPHRPKKDPRNLRVLDPAVGSGHFLLRAYDLLVIIYEEAWADPESPPFGDRRLSEDFASLEDLRRAVPELILRHNLHGIDIDSRASQIAALALWLRAQRAYMEMNLSASARPAIRRSNIVTAEPMPGETELLDEFASDLQPRLLGNLVRVIWDKMRLAGDAGSLLRIDVELQDAIAAARSQWQRQPQDQQLALFGESLQRPEQLALFDVSGISDERFWDEAEDRTLAALAAYADRAAGAARTTRGLFAEDAAQGFALIDVVTRTYDAVLMNPPFGSAAKDSVPYLRTAYPDSWTELYAAFVRRSVEWVGESGFVGCITSSLFLYTRQLRSFREGLVDTQRLSHFVELGSRVLDGATVDTGLSIYAGRCESVAYIDLTGEDQDKRADTLLDVAASDQWKRHDLRRFRLLDMTPFPFHLDDKLLDLWSPGAHLQPDLGIVATGNHTFDDFRFVRLSWEVSAARIGPDAWIWFEKGGEFQPFLSPTRLLVDWSHEGRSMRALNIARHGSDAQVMQSSRYWGRAGLTFAHVSSIGFGPRAMPEGGIFSSESISVFCAEQNDRLSLLGLLSSTLAQDLVWAFGRHRKIENRAVAGLPLGRKHVTEARVSGVEEVCADAIDVVWQAESSYECSPLFTVPSGIEKGQSGLVECRTELVEAMSTTLERLDAKAASVILGSEGGDSASAIPRQQLVGKYISRDIPHDTLVSYAVGVAFGRWDVRLALDPTLVPKPGDPFAALPPCAPGMLQGPDGLPAGEARIAPEAWLWARLAGAGASTAAASVGQSNDGARYPFPVAWGGILVDDPGIDDIPHGDDIVARIRAAFDVLWPSNDGSAALAIEAEVCENLRVRTLREYFRRPGGFFADHLARYSESRRQAPIYWPLSTASGSYTLWVYYPRVSDDLLYRAATDYVDPKLADVDRSVAEIVARLAVPVVGNAPKLRDQLDELRRLRGELADLRTELLRVADLPYRPNLDDGVLISAAPIHSLFRLPKWRADLKACWDKLQAGEYDWTHLAFAVWPGRVREVCRHDQSIAITQGLEDLYVVPTRGTTNSKLRRAATKVAGMD